MNYVTNHQNGDALGQLTKSSEEVFRQMVHVRKYLLGSGNIVLAVNGFKQPSVDLVGVVEVLGLLPFRKLVSDVACSMKEIETHWIRQKSVVEHKRLLHVKDSWLQSNEVGADGRVSTYCVGKCSKSKKSR